MKVIADGIAYAYDGAKLSVIEAIAIEEHTGLSLGDYREKLGDLAAILRDKHDPTGLRALQALIGIARHRAGDDSALASLGEVDFDLATLNFETSPTEKASAAKESAATAKKAAAPGPRRRRPDPQPAQ